MGIFSKPGSNPTDIPVSSLASGTDGELITWDANGDPATVGVGTSGEVLTSNGAGAAPTFQAASGGDYVLISSAVASSDTSIEFSITGYNSYQIIIEDLLVTGASMFMRTSADGGSTFDNGLSDYKRSQYGYGESVSTSVDYDNADDLIRLYRSNHGTDAGEESTFIVDILSAGNSATKTYMTCQYVGFNDTPQYHGMDFSGIRVAVETVDAVQFAVATGTIASGNFKLYGRT
jgi:hypothetical protein